MNNNGGGPGEQAAVTSPTGLSFIVGFFFSFRLFIMLLAVRLLGTNDQTGVEISLVLNFMLLGLVAFQSIGAIAHKDTHMLSLPSVRWVAIFVCFSGCSLLWSVTASLPAAIVYWCAMTADVATVILLLRTKRLPEVAAALMEGFVWGACAVAIIAWMLPAQSDLRLGDEELLGPNQIGYLCAFSLFFVQYLMRVKKGGWRLPGFILSVTLLRSLSKTSILAFLIAESFLLMRDKSISRRTKVMLILSAAVTALAFASLLTSYFDLYASSGNSSETLTGRIGIWAFILNEAAQSPWIGHGFHSVWKVIPPFGEFEARHAHNELIQQFYSYGVFGVCMMVGLYGSFFRQIRKRASGSLKTLYYAMLLFVLVRGLTDTEAFDFSLPLWAIVMFSFLMNKAYVMSRRTEGHLDGETVSLPRHGDTAPVAL